MIDVKELQILNTTKCECGHEYSLKDFTNLEMLQDAHGFYANLVKHYCITKCPECGANRILLLKQKGQTWEVINTAILKSDMKKCENITENDSKNVEIQQNEVITSNGETAEDFSGEHLENNSDEQTTIENETENNQTQEFICPECGRVCKSQIGLNSHIKTHQN